MQSAIVARYSPYFAWFDRSGSGTLPTGCGAPLIIIDTGKATTDCGTKFLIGGMLSKYATNE